MKFKSTEENIDEPIVNNAKCDEECDLCRALEIMSSQLDLAYSILSSIRSSIDTVKTLHEVHNSK